ncbi:MAG: CBS domain-containing protein [Balneolaceae bacterium]|nr:CBS domain-containing protein [Balneolaceae bacterium]
MTTEDIMTMAEVSEMEGSIRSDEREIIENVIEFGTTAVREIMTSRVNIVAVSTEDTLDSVLSLIRGKGFSRMPLFENDQDNILGVVYSKDVLPILTPISNVRPSTGEPSLASRCSCRPLKSWMICSEYFSRKNTYCHCGRRVWRHRRTDHTG